MIKKLKEHDIIDPKTDKVIGKIGCDLREIMDKLNELVDAVNAIQKEREAEWFEIQEWIGIIEAVRKSVNKLETMAKNTNTVLESLVQENNIHEKQIDELQMKVEPEKCETPADLFEEQRQWIGKLCWFSNGDGFDEVGYLTGIDPDMPETKFQCDCHDWYEECKPVRPDDDIIYNGE